MASSMAMAVLASLVVLAPCEAAPATVFVDVSVVPMSRETVLPRRTVIVRDGRIVAIGESRRLKPPAGARIIDGRGRYLAAVQREVDAILDEKAWTLPAHDANLVNFNGRVVEVDLGAAMRPPPVPNPLRLLAIRQGFGLRKIS
jgi:hypothetical protein